MTNDITILPIGGLLVQQRMKDGMFNAADVLNQWNGIHGTNTSINDFIEEEKKFSIYFTGKDISSISDDGWIDDFHFRNFLIFLSPELGMVDIPIMQYEKEHPFAKFDKTPTPKTIVGITHTYILTDGSGLYKIGKSIDVRKRVKSLMIGNPSIRIVAIFHKDVESMLHDIFKEKRVAGEWFRLTKSDLERVKNI